MIDPRTPVLAGVGTCFDDAEAVELMIRSAVAAAHDAGAPSLLGAVQRIAVPRGTWSYTDPGRLIGERVGSPDAQTVLADIGIPQQTLINQAMTSILAGELDVVLVVGAEAKARAARVARRSTAADASGISQVMRRDRSDREAEEIDQRGATPDVHLTPQDEIVSRAEIEAGLWAPVEQYALIESALGAAEGTAGEVQRREIAALWARFNAVAQSNPEAAFPDAMDADVLATLGPHNRPLAFPYGKWHASQWTVDQAAALLVCSTEAAARYGVSRDRQVFPVVGLESSFSLPLTSRRLMHRWPAMAVLGQVAGTHLGHPVSECDHAEVYSCFPAAVRVQQRELGLDLDATPTVTGGMSFAGGPFNSFVLQATAAMARRLRDQRGLGLVTTVSGLLTKPGLAVWSSEPGDGPPFVADLANDAADATQRVESVPACSGRATVVASTVTYEGFDPKDVIAVVDTDNGQRAIARSDDGALVSRATHSGLAGETVTQIAGSRIV